MKRRPQRSTRTHPLFPSPTLFRSREIFGEPMRAIPAFREPGPRLELMDEQGLDRTLMFPTLASLVEERLRDDPEATHAVVHALNEWLYRSEEHTSELQSLMRISYAVLCLKQKKQKEQTTYNN